MPIDHRTLPINFFFSSRRRHTRCGRDWSSDVCSSDLLRMPVSRSTAKMVVFPMLVIKYRSLSCATPWGYFREYGLSFDEEKTLKLVSSRDRKSVVRERV